MLDHSWDISPKAAIALQRELAGRAIVEPLAGPVRTVAGIDCAFARDGERIIAAAILCDAATMKPVGQSHVVMPCRFPYVPGLLSFREAPAVLEAFARLPARPDLLMIDGQGLAHPRRMGIATHVGLWLDAPTVGVAKSRYCGEHRTPGLRRGCWTRLREGGEVVGAVLRTRAAVAPLYVSVGHRVTLADAIAWTLRCTRGVRLPEPSRLAHQLVSRLKVELGL